MELKGLVDRLSEITGCPEIVPNENGVYTIEVDDVTVCILELVELRGLFVWSAVGSLPNEDRAGFCERLLEKGFLGLETGGAVLSVDDGVAYLHRMESLDGADENALHLIIEQMAETVRELRSDWSTKGQED